MKKILLSLILLGTIKLAISQEVLYYCSKSHPSGAWQVYKKNLTEGSIATITSNTTYNYWWVELSPNNTQLLMLRSPYSLSLIHISEPTRRTPISYAVFCLKK